ncbi:MAG: PorP/SprF family type IX secretion system membrane protein [Bacteroidales bacterium]|nr:PorP/SprF family type IX secretion system membrane protein [Bacteroidales bacterium]
MKKLLMNNIARLLLVFFAFLSFTFLQAQQEQHNVHNMFNQLSYNPGFAGSVNGICATGLIRQQWVGFEGAPATYNINIHSPLSVVHGGIGASIYQDELGYQKEIGVKLMYAYRHDLGMGNLGVGVQVGFINGSVDFSQFEVGKNVRDGGDYIIEGKQEVSDMLLDFGLGVQYFVPEKFYVGISSTRLSEQESPDDLLAYKSRRHYYLNAGYMWALPGNPSFVLEPSILVKSDGTKTEYDLAGLLKYNNKFWGGVSFSANSTLQVKDPLAVLVGIAIKDVKIGYAYTVPTSQIGSGGSHEVMVGYCFKINFDKGRRSYKNTRFL